MRTLGIGLMVAALGLAGFDAHAKDEAVRIGYVEFAPITFTNAQGQLDGHGTRSMVKLLEAAGLSWRATSLPAARLWDGLKDGSVQLWLGIEVPELADHVLRMKDAAFVLDLDLYWKGQRKLVERPEDLVGASVVLIRGYSYSEWGRFIRARASGVRFFEAANYEAALQMLRRDRADYLLAYRLPLTEDQGALATQGLESRQVATMPCYLQVAKKAPGAQSLLDRLDAAQQSLPGSPAAAGPAGGRPASQPNPGVPHGKTGRGLSEGASR
jgi:polar amino acid transport system substrate-binding protein